MMMMIIIICSLCEKIRVSCKDLSVLQTCRCLCDTLFRVGFHETHQEIESHFITMKESRQSLLIVKDDENTRKKTEITRNRSKGNKVD